MEKRHIIFRGKRVDNGDWVYGYYVNYGTPYIYVGNNLFYEVIPETVGQFTGLKDNNGLVNIYEGDIIDLDGLKKGDKYKNPNLLREKFNFVIEKMGTKSWRSTEQKAMEQGCFYAE